MELFEEARKKNCRRRRENWQNNEKLATRDTIHPCTVLYCTVLYCTVHPCLACSTIINTYLGLGNRMVKFSATFKNYRLLQVRQKAPNFWKKSDFWRFCHRSRRTLTRASKIFHVSLRRWARLTTIKIWSLWSNPTSGDRAISGGIMFDSTTADYKAAGQR